MTVFRREWLLAFMKKRGMENPGRLSNLSGETDQVVPVLDGYIEKYIALSL